MSQRVVFNASGLLPELLPVFDGCSASGEVMIDRKVDSDAPGPGTRLSDTIVLAIGIKARSELAMQFDGLAPQVFKIGDCVKPRKIYDAFHEAWNVVFSF